MAGMGVSAGSTTSRGARGQDDTCHPWAATNEDQQRGGRGWGISSASRRWGPRTRDLQVVRPPCAAPLPALRCPLASGRLLTRELAPAVRRPRALPLGCRLVWLGGWLLEVPCAGVTKVRQQPAYRTPAAAHRGPHAAAAAAAAVASLSTPMAWPAVAALKAGRGARAAAAGHGARLAAAGRRGACCAAGRRRGVAAAG